ncbi:hypothetical protein OIDMADRAFT_152464 [Oidiodendron maius Zn]|uniref:EXPERA domain-containing protein n=1 Tax=Oidiodendron maius (strain Zn) TaxID=913774 RepID=A0A0C3I1F1_OIDMZ|nr:hypothetical protein OIDMADRAFT_152464 [Oidiodendron maius Zn]
MVPAEGNVSQHPYYPIGVALSGGAFIPNEWSVLSLVHTFAAGLTALLLVTFLVAKRARPYLSGEDQALVLWFILTGSIHVFFEGYFVLHHHRMAGVQSFFGQLWKEYALSDSRYMTSDPLVLCMETCTVITWGPLSLLTALLIVRDSSYRHPIQALVSTGHVYGDTLYFATTVFDEFYSGKVYYRPEPFYFWIYFVLMNAVWLVIPGYCLYSSIKATATAFTASKVDAVERRKKKL